MHSLRIIYTDVPKNAVGIANRYGLDGPGIEPQWGQDFPYATIRVLGPTNIGCRVFLVSKAARAWGKPPNVS